MNGGVGTGLTGTALANDETREAKDCVCLVEQGAGRRLLKAGATTSGRKDMQEMERVWMWAVGGVLVEDLVRRARRQFISWVG